MKTNRPIHPNPCVDNWQRHCHGVALLLTLVMMVVLTTLAYTLTMRTQAQRYRSHYFIDYAKARYACDSAMKFMLTRMQTSGFEPNCIARPNEPDFSDLFSLTDDQVKTLIASYADRNSTSTSGLNPTSAGTNINDINGAGFGVEDMPNDANWVDRVQGPYGPPWPYAMQPIKIDIDDTTHAKIEVIDENAKYPLAWLMLNDPNIDSEMQVSFQTFGEWMGLSSSEQQDVRKQLQDITAIKPFQTHFKAINNPQSKPRQSRSRSRSRSKGRGNVAPAKLSPAVQEERQNQDFANLLNSSLFQTDVLARPTYQSNQRSESALKYIGRWGSMKVNVNTAPQQVLEAALVFGGDSVPVAAEIMRQRQQKPFTSIDDLKKRVNQYADQIDTCAKLDFITTRSTRFTVRVTAYSGVAKVTALASIELTGQKSSNTHNNNKSTNQGNSIKVLALVSE